MSLGTQRTITLLKLAFSLGLISLLFWIIDLDKMLEAVKNVKPVFLFAGFALFIVQGILEGLRLTLVYSSYGITPGRGFKLFIVGLFFSNFMPGMVGADVYQVQQMHSIEPGVMRPVSLSFFLRVTGLAVNVLLAMVGLILASRHFSWTLSIPALESAQVWVAILALAALFIAGVTVILGRTRKGLFRRIWAHVPEALKQVRAAMQSIAPSKHVGIIMLGVLIVLTRVSSLTLLVWAFGFRLGIPDALTTVTLSTVITGLPISIAGLGVSEISRTAFLAAFGVPSSAAFAIAVMGRLFLWTLSSFGGLWFFIDSMRNPERSLAGQSTKSSEQNKT